MIRFAACAWLVLIAFTASGCGSGDGQLSQETSRSVAVGSTGLTADAPNALQAENNKWVHRVVQCLRDKGWDAEAFESSPGELGYRLASKVPQSQLRAWDRDMMKVCPKEAGGFPETPELTPEQVDRMYDFLLDERECLIGQGYAIGTPPSRETWVSAYSTNHYWIPYSELPELGPSARFELEKKCPQEPPDSVLK